MSAALKPRSTRERQQPQNDRYWNNCSTKPRAGPFVIDFKSISDFSVIVMGEDEAAGALAVSTGLHGLRSAPHDAQTLVTTTDDGVYPTARPAAVVLSNPGAGVVAPRIYEGSPEVEAGNGLIEAKELVPHGGWARWLSDNVPAMSERTACRYMQIARSGLQIGHVAEMGIRAAAESLARRRNLSPMQAPDYGEFKVHPVDDCFPLMPDDEFASLVASIAKHGLFMPIALTADGTTIVDGRLRYLACVEAGAEPRFTRLPESFTEEQIAGHIVDANVHRHHHSPDQRAMIEAELANMDRTNPVTQPEAAK